MIWIILYILYLILNFTYKEFKISEHIEYISNLNQSIKDKIDDANQIIKYKSSLAYKNKVLKQQQSFKNKWEEVVYLTSEEFYNKFTWEIKINTENEEELKDKNKELNDIDIFNKWMLLIFKKDTY